MLKSLFESTKNTLLSAPKPLSETPIDAIDQLLHHIVYWEVFVAGRVCYGRGSAVLGMGGWRPVVTGLIPEMHRISLNYLVLVCQLMGILS